MQHERSFMVDQKQEIEFAKAFLEKNARRRFLFLLKSKKGRRKILSDLDHRITFDRRFCHKIPNSCQSSQNILEILRRKGAKENCYAISQLPSLDESTLDLRDALDLAVGSGTGTILCCIIGRLAYYEGEEVSERYVLEKI